MRTGPLAFRDFRLLFFGQSLSVLGDAVGGLATVFAALEVTGSATGAGLALAAQAIPMALLLLVGGVTADRLPRRIVMVVSDLVRCAAQVAFALLLLTGRASLLTIILVLVVFGSASAFFRPAMSGLVPRTVPAEHLQQANAFIGVSPSVGIAIGGALGGVLVAFFSPAGALAIDATTFLVSAILLSRMTSGTQAASLGQGSILRDVRAGWREVRKRSWLLTAIIAESGYAIIVIPVIFVVGPLVATQDLGGPAAWGIIDSAFGVGWLLGGIVAFRLTPQRPVVVAYLALAGLIPHLLFLAVPTSTWAIALATIPAGMAVVVWLTLWTTTMQREIPADMLSRVSSIELLGNQAFAPLGFALAGPLAALLGTRGAFLLAAAVVMANIAAVLAVPSARAIGAAPARPDADSTERPDRDVAPP